MRWEKKNIDGQRTTIIRTNQQSTISKVDQSSIFEKTNYDRSKISSIYDLIQHVGEVPKEILEQARKEAIATGKFVGEILEEKGIISHDSILALLIKQCKIPLVSLLSYAINPNSIQMIPPEVCEKYGILPIDIIGNTITLALIDPMNKEAIETAKKYCSGYQIRPILCSYKEYERVKKRYFQISKYSTHQKSDDKTDSITEENRNSENNRIYTERNDTSEIEKNSEDDIPYAIETDTQDTNLSTEKNREENTQKEKVLLQTLFTEPISSETSLTKIEDKEDLTIQDLAYSMISSLRGSYELLVRKIKLFNGLIPEEAANLLHYANQIQLNQGDVLFNKGDKAGSLYILISGRIEIFDNDKHICYLSPGEMLGEMAVITQNRRSASARADEDSVLLELNLTQIYRFIPPIVAIKLLTNIIFTLSERLEKITGKLQK